MPTRKVIFAFALFASLTIMGACSDDDNPVKVPAVVVPGFASADMVAASYVTAFGDLDVGLLGSALHPDYQMLLQTGTVEKYPQVGTSLDLAEQLTVAARLFGGAPVMDPGGSLLPAISAIHVDVFEQQGTWEEIPAGQPFAGSQAGLFWVNIRANRTDFSSMQVDGLLRFFMAANDTTIAGTDYTYWQLVGLQDLTGNLKQSSETVSWGSVQAMYWIGE